jgi:hypothetical protein
MKVIWDAQLTYSPRTIRAGGGTCPAMVYKLHHHISIALWFAHHEVMISFFHVPSHYRTISLLVIMP